MPPRTIAKFISITAGVIFYVGVIAAVGYFGYIAIEGRFVLVHALLALLALLVMRLVQVWYRVKAKCSETSRATSASLHAVPLDLASI